MKIKIIPIILILFAGSLHAGTLSDEQIAQLATQIKADNAYVLSHPIHIPTAAELEAERQHRLERERDEERENQERMQRQALAAKEHEQYEKQRHERLTQEAEIQAEANRQANRDANYANERAKDRALEAAEYRLMFGPPQVQSLP